MKQDYSISIYLDTRREKASGKFPVKLRVYTSSPRKQKFFPTSFEFGVKEFDSIWNTTKPRKDVKSIRLSLQAIELKAVEVANGLESFSFKLFEKKLYRKESDGQSVKYHYEETIKDLKEKERLGSASSYDSSMKALREYCDTELNTPFDRLLFKDITSEWLFEFEEYCIKRRFKKVSSTTVAIYLRALRALFNKAIDEGEINQSAYPFGKRKYQIPAKRNVKKALSNDQLKMLFELDPDSPEQKKARDFWFFSFSCNGMNMKDIALLKYKDISGDKIEFVRAKTSRTSRGNQKPIIVYLNSFALGVIETYGNKEKARSNYVFDILKEGMSAETQRSSTQNFTRLVNQHMKNLCKKEGLPSEISTYWARHSFATSAVRNGASLEFIQESLGHSNLTTTQNYFAGFDNEARREFANSLMKF